MTTRVLIVDDSALFRTLLRRAFEAEPGAVVVGAAADPYEARDLIVAHRPDIITLDIGLPRMDGITFLRKLMASQLATRTVVLSSATLPGSRLAQEASEAGALDVIQKPACTSLAARTAALREVARSVLAHAKAPFRARSSLGHRPSNEGTPSAVRVSLASGGRAGAVIGLGASTGGVAALGEILPRFPAHAPPIVVVQHMPAGFTASFAARLAELCPMRVLEAVDGQVVEPGLILVAPGGPRHLELVAREGAYHVALVEGPPVSGHVPSVDVFFASLARSAGALAVACLLTGMGRDGAEGLARLRRAGAHTFAQDEASSAVWGMPAAAHELGAAEALLALDQVPPALLRAAGATLRLSDPPPEPEPRTATDSARPSRRPPAAR